MAEGIVLGHRSEAERVDVLGPVVTGAIDGTGDLCEGAEAVATLASIGSAMPACVTVIGGFGAACSGLGAFQHCEDGVQLMVAAYKAKDVWGEVIGGSKLVTGVATGVGGAIRLLGRIAQVVGRLPEQVAALAALCGPIGTVFLVALMGLSFFRSVVALREGQLLLREVRSAGSFDALGEKGDAFKMRLDRVAEMKVPKEGDWDRFVGTVENKVWKGVWVNGGMALLAVASASLLVASLVATGGVPFIVVTAMSLAITVCWLVVDLQGLVQAVKKGEFGKWEVAALILVGAILGALLAIATVVSGGGPFFVAMAVVAGVGLALQVILLVRASLRSVK